MKEQLEFIVDTLFGIKGNDVLILSDPILVRCSPHTWPFEVHGLCVCPKKQLYVMDSSGDWNELNERDAFADRLIPSIYQRVRITFKPATVE